ncbi:MAG: hypothetical protein ACXWZU_00535 [Actinomycetota bacterium]
MATLVRHVMTETPKTLSSSMDAYDAAGIMASYDVGAGIPTRSTSETW